MYRSILSEWRGFATRTKKGTVDMTFGTLLDRYIDSLTLGTTQEEYRKIQRRFFHATAWNDRPASEVTRYDLLLLRQELESTPAYANKVIGLPKQAYYWGSNTIDETEKRPVYEGNNPALHLKRYSCPSRETLLDLTQLKRLLDNLDFLSVKYQVFLLLRILVPGRITELCAIKWSDLDLVVGKWTKLNTKNGRIHVVPLPTQALAALRRMPNTSGYVFTGAYGRPLRPGSARKIWGRFRADLKMPDIWLLDFRRTLASYLYTVIKADDLLVKAMLDHYDSRPCAVYTRLSFDYLAPIIQGYADWVCRLSPILTQQGHDHDRVLTERGPATGARPIS